MADPKKGPLQLQTGTSLNPESPNAPIRNMDPSLQNVDHLAYLRRQALADHGLVGAAVSGEVKGLFDLQQQIGPFVSASHVLGQMHTCYMNDFMKNCLQQHDCGITTDATFDLFKWGKLISSSVYVAATACWVPVLLTWVVNLTEQDYVHHFVVLLQVIFRLQLPPDEEDKKVAQVVDFSLAQKNGFVTAYCQLKGITDSMIEHLIQCDPTIMGLAVKISRTLFLSSWSFIHFDP